MNNVNKTFSFDLKKGHPKFYLKRKKNQWFFNEVEWFGKEHW